MMTNAPTAVFTDEERFNAIARIRLWIGAVRGRGVLLAKAFGIHPPGATQVKKGNRNVTNDEIERARPLLRMSRNILVAPLTKEEYDALSTLNGFPLTGGAPVSDPKKEFATLHERLGTLGPSYQQAFVAAMYESFANLMVAGGQGKRSNERP